MSLFSSYRAAGLCAIPLKNGIPMAKWGQYAEVLPPEGEAQQWDSKGFKEYALVCGKVSNVIALDIDTDDAATIAKIEALAGVSPVKKIGSKGFTSFYKYNGERTNSWSGIVEILSDKHLTTLPPSKHRNKPNVIYKWNKEELIGANLPALAPSFCAVMDVLYPKPRSEPTQYSYTRDFDHIELIQAEKMLSFIDSDCARDEWVQIGMALRDEFGDTACGLWHDWSSGAPGRYKRQDAQSAWRSFNGHGVSIGTLIHKAKQGGFQFEPPARIEKVARIEPAPQIIPAAAAPAPQAPKEKTFDPHVPGLVGEIADWITATAMRPQPALSLAAALAFMGMVKAHRVKGFTNLRTNFYCLSMADTGYGKEYPEVAITELMHACALGKHKLGKPKSGSAVLTGLGKAGCRGLLTLSEVGHFAANFMDKKAGGFQKEIGHLIIELFNKAGMREYMGDQYADEKLHKQAILHEPNLSILGSSVPEQMQAAITGGEVVNGFLNRWIAFEVKTRPRKIRVQHTAPPKELVDKILGWLNDNPPSTDSYGIHNPKMLKFTREAYDDLIKYGEEMDDLMDRALPHTKPLYVRAAEHAEKIAMIITDGNDIGTPEFNKAVEIVAQSNKVIAEFCRGISNSPHDAMVYKVLEAIKKNGLITKRDLTRTTQWLEPKKRADIIFQLLESEEIVADKDAKSVTYRYLG